jgi:hypothetical protein
MHEPLALALGERKENSLFNLNTVTVRAILFMFDFCICECGWMSGHTARDVPSPQRCAKIIRATRKLSTHTGLY